MEESRPTSRYAKETIEHPTVEIIPSSVGVERLKRAFLAKSIDKDRDTLAILNSSESSPKGSSFKGSPTASIDIPTSKSVEYGIVEAVIRAATAVGLDPKAFVQLEPEEPLCIAENGQAVYSYRELVRQNHFKDYRSDVTPTELEKYLSDEEFLAKFGMNQVRYRYRFIFLKYILMNLI